MSHSTVDYEKIRRRLVRQSVEKEAFIYPAAKEFKDELRWKQVSGSNGPHRLTTTRLIQAATNDEDPAPAVFAVIVYIPPHRAQFFRSDAKWRPGGPSGLQVDYAKARANCNGMDPKIEALEGDFDALVSLLKEAEKMMLPNLENFQKVGGALNFTAIKDEITIKFNHHLFEVCCLPLL